MLAYWLLFAFFAAGTFLHRAQRPDRPATYPFLSIGALLVAVLVGFRDEVGKDWGKYEQMFRVAGYTDLGSAVSLDDPGYEFLNWAAQQLGGGIWLVNFVCALIFAWGLLRFARTQADPWLTILVAVPYLIVVVAMGYTRQSVALGILMAGLASMNRGGSVIRFALFVAVATLFHKTAVVALLIVLFASQRNRLLNVIGGAAALYLLYTLFLAEAADTYIQRYIDEELASEGAAIRLVMSLVPALLFLMFRRRLGFDDREHRIWRNFAFAAIGLFIMLLVFPSSTAVDRLALYVMPLQLAILPRIPGTLLGSGFGKVIVVLFAFSVQFVWLNFASHAEAWLPYQFYPIG